MAGDNNEELRAVQTLSPASGRAPASCPNAEPLRSLALPSIRPDRRGDLLRQAGVARSLGSPFVGAVLTAAHRQLGRAPRLEETIAEWPLDPLSSAMALRLNAGLHALARRGSLADLTALYAGRHDNFDRAIGEALEQGEDTLLTWMEHPTQTNEVCRSSAFMAALTLLSARHGMPFELLEIGASAGLNLLLDRYGHDLGGRRCGDISSPLQLVPRWDGPMLPDAPVRIASARGVDLRPLRLDDEQTRERLQSYVWPGDHVRADHLERAIRLASQTTPVVERGSAVPWLADELRKPQSAGTMRVIQHSMVRQYLQPGDRATLINVVGQAGLRASVERPLALMGLEWNAPRTKVLLMLIRWTGEPIGEVRILAECHPYGASIRWFGADVEGGLAAA